jgi:hypothetical protein
VSEPFVNRTNEEATHGEVVPGTTPPITVRPAAQPESQGRKLARVLALVGALGIAAMGLLAGAAGIVVGLLGAESDRLTMVTAGASFVALCVGLGLAVAWQAGRAISGQRSGPFLPRRIGTWVLLFVAAVILGQLVLSLDLAPPLIFPVFHIVAAASPPLILLALVGRYVGGVARWRDVVLEIGSGAFLSTFLAFTLEFVAMLSALVLGLAVVAVQPGGVELLQSLASRFQDPAWLQNPINLAPLIESPVVVAALFLLFAGVVPLIEEAVKTLGVGLLAYRHPTLPQAVLWGLACGAGFALAEGLFNSISGLDLWAGIVLLRVGASLLHVFSGGLMGLAWYYLLAERRQGRTLGLYGASVGVHGLWNALAAAMSLVSLPGTGQAGAGPVQTIAGFGTFAILALLLLLALGVMVGLVGLARFARRHGSAAQARTLPATATAGGQG